MSFSTNTLYNATNQSWISQYVPDDNDGSLAYAISEKTTWQLEKTSALALGPDVIATKSGTGRWVKLYSASSPPFSGNTATVDFDFGSGPPQETSVTVDVAATWVTASMVFSFSVSDTATHTAEDAVLESLQVQVISITPGVGFSVMAMVQSGTNGVYRVVVKGILDVYPDPWRTLHRSRRDRRIRRSPGQHPHRPGHRRVRDRGERGGPGNPCRRHRQDRQAERHLGRLPSQDGARHAQVLPYLPRYHHEHERCPAEPHLDDCHPVGRVPEAKRGQQRHVWTGRCRLHVHVLFCGQHAAGLLRDGHQVRSHRSPGGRGGRDGPHVRPLRRGRSNGRSLLPVPGQLAPVRHLLRRLRLRDNLRRQRFARPCRQRGRSLSGDPLHGLRRVLDQQPSRRQAVAAQVERVEHALPVPAGRGANP